MTALPTGTVTFLFTDIEGSTRLLQSLGGGYPDAFQAHRRLLRKAVEEAGGYEFETQGDGLFVAFPTAKEALVAAVAAQRALHEYPWPAGAPLRVRMGLHTGQPTVTDSGYIGLDLHRTARICTAGHGGQILVSQTTRDLAEDELTEGVALQDLGEHRLKDLTRAQRLFQVVVPGLPSDFPPLRSLDVLPNNLPIQLTGFVGRERELTEIKRLIHATRLLTLTGPGGAGKTRLALQAAAELLDVHPDGVWLVELASLADPSLVPQTVAATLRLREEPNRPLTETLSDFLRPKFLLLVLDNCEHVLAACVKLAYALLRTCPSLRMLATSREPLGLAGETVWGVPPLSLPNTERLPSLGSLREYEAIRLFVERAIAAHSTFTLTSQNGQAVAQICHRLDGMPLAIELAAARVKVLSPDQIANRLDDRFNLLTGGSRAALPQQQTLRATMDWSYELLSEREQMLFRRLAVFAGGFTLDAAEAVCAWDGVRAANVLDLLARLVEKSLVVFEDQQGRYRQLETVRQYGRDRLTESGEGEEVRRRHRDVFLELAEAADPHLGSERYEAWLKPLEIERDNLRAALQWSLETDDAEEALRLSGVLAWFWYYRGPLSEAERWLKEAIDRGQAASIAARAKAVFGAAMLARQWNLKEALRLTEDALTLYGQIGDVRGTARSLYNLGLAHKSAGEHERATAALEQSLPMFRDVGDRWGVASVLRHRGDVAARQGDYARATAWLEESLTLNRELGYGRGIAWSLSFLGRVELYQQSLARAAVRLEESVSILREIADTEGLVFSLAGLAHIARRGGDARRARALYKESLSSAAETKSKPYIMECLYGVAATEVVQGHIERAARLFGAAEVLREAVGLSVPPVERDDYERHKATGQTAIGKATFDALQAEGRAMTLEQAVEYALKDDRGMARP